MSEIFAIQALPRPTVAVAGTTARFPVHRIYCVGRNYAEHALEMGTPIEREAPVFFMKPADAVVADGAQVPYPPATSNLHHEVELVIALAQGGRDIDPGQARELVFGYAVGIDLTRRDLQAAAKAKSLPWDTAKGFDLSAPISAIHRVAAVGHPASGPLTLAVNGQLRQSTDIREMIFDVPSILHELSKLFELRAGDLVFTGTPAGVAALVAGDRVSARFADFATLDITIA